MSNNTLFLLAVSAMLLSVSSCKKYDQDGSLFQLRAPEKRILGNWESVRVQEVGVESDTNMTDLLGSNNLRLDVEFRDDETVTILNEGEEIMYEGIWSFNDDASVLLMEVSNMETVGPFYLDSDSVNQNALHSSYADLLLMEDTIIFEAGSYVDVSETVIPQIMQLMTTFTAFTYAGGNAFYEFEIGDDVTAVMGDFIDDLLSEDLIDSMDDYEGIIAGMTSEYGVELNYEEVSAGITGWDDPNLIGAIFDAYGLEVDVFIGTLATSASDPIIVEYINANLGLGITESFNERLKELSIYWKILELELDDLQAYQFREYNGEDIYDYAYLLRFEQMD